MRKLGAWLGLLVGPSKTACWLFRSHSTSVRRPCRKCVVCSCCTHCLLCFAVMPYLTPAAAAAAATHLLLLLLSCAGAASIGVIRVNDMAALQAAYHRVVKDLSKAKVGSAGRSGGAAQETNSTARHQSGFEQALCVTCMALQQYSLVCKAGLIYTDVQRTCALPGRHHAHTCIVVPFWHACEVYARYLPVGVCCADCCRCPCRGR